MTPRQAYGFVRRLTKLTDTALLHQFVIDSLAIAVGAEAGSLAVTEGDELVIVATHGYPAVLVQNLRIARGEGILGRVLSTRRPVVMGSGGAPSLHQLRYRTSAFMAVPLLGTGEPLGVAAVADPRSGAFDGDALSVVRGLAAAASTALMAARLRTRTTEAAHSAGIDPLTRLSNRRHFEARLEQERQRVQRYNGAMALLLIDVDDFKTINDTYGHAVGDEVLRGLAGLLQRSVRVFDVCVRYGGDEFAVLMPATTIENAVATAERMRARIEREPIVRIRGAAARRVTVTIGVSAYNRELTPGIWLAAADQALYDAKTSGKNRVSLAMTS